MFIFNTYISPSVVCAINRQNIILKYGMRDYFLYSMITRKKSKGNEIVDLFCILIDWIPQTAVALYIYRVGGLAP